MKEEIKLIDCFGDICPIPILKIEKQLAIMNSGEEFLLVTDHSCTLEAIKQKYKRPDVRISIEEVMNGVWEIHFKKK